MCKPFKRVQYFFFPEAKLVDERAQAINELIGSIRGESKSFQESTRSLCSRKFLPAVMRKSSAMTRKVS